MLLSDHFTLIKVFTNYIVVFYLVFTHVGTSEDYNIIKTPNNRASERIQLGYKILVDNKVLLLQWF